MQIRNGTCIDCGNAALQCECADREEGELEPKMFTDDIRDKFIRLLNRYFDLTRWDTQKLIVGCSDCKPEYDSSPGRERWSHTANCTSHGM